MGLQPPKDKWGQFFGKMFLEVSGQRSGVLVILDFFQKGMGLGGSKNIVFFLFFVLFPVKALLLQLFLVEMLFERGALPFFLWVESQG